MSQRWLKTAEICRQANRQRALWPEPEARPSPAPGRRHRTAAAADGRQPCASSIEIERRAAPTRKPGRHRGEAGRQNLPGRPCPQAVAWFLAFQDSMEKGRPCPQAADGLRAPRKPTAHTPKARRPFCSLRRGVTERNNRPPIGAQQAGGTQLRQGRRNRCYSSASSAAATVSTCASVMPLQSGRRTRRSDKSSV